MKRGIVVLFGLTSFVASALLFSVQPMMGKMVLPIFGGTPAVWNTCLVFFQAALLVGYLFVHGTGHTAWAARWRVSAPFLLGLTALFAAGYVMQPLVIRPDPDQSASPTSGPALVLLAALTMGAALPLIMVSATAPLTQSWFALTGHPRGADPYFLYAASNMGSLLALLAYPSLIEPNLGLTTQSRLWRTGFLVLALLVLLCGLLARRLSRARSIASVDDDHPPRLDSEMCQAETRSQDGLARAIWMRWLVLVFVPSSWLLGVTAYVTTDLASIPLLWIIPLAIYLLSFILAFTRWGPRLGRAAVVSLPYLIAPLVLVMSAGFVHLIWIPLHLLVFFAGCLACHGALAEARPSTRFLSAYYVATAFGGLLGGIWSAIVAPILFARVVEYHLAIVLACLVALGNRADRDSWTVKRLSLDLVFAGVVFFLTLTVATNQVGLLESALGVACVILAAGLGVLSCLGAQRRPVRFALVIVAVMASAAAAPGPNGKLLHIERDFFGVIRVTLDPEQNVHWLFHGSTLHGQQSFEPALEREPSTYFTRSGPIGDLFKAIDGRLNRPGAQIAIVGLGAGTLASYARPLERWTFYEIDASMVRVARDPRYFTYLKNCLAESTDVVLGDARLRLAAAPVGAYQLIVLDAFSSDAVPVHLLSREAIQLYRSKLACGGVLAFNLSNRYLDLEPVIARQAVDVGLVCRVRRDVQVIDDEKREGKQASIWAVMATTEVALGALATDERWRRPAERRGSAVWTDDYSDVASYLLLTPRSRPKRD